MIATAHSITFQGIEAIPVQIQCAISPGLPSFKIVGLPDKTVSEARERIRTALHAMSISLPSKRIIVNMSPADLPKEGAHFDLPIALSLLTAIDVLPKDAIDSVMAMGELALDSALVYVPGALPAAMTASAGNQTLLCPTASGAEAAWVEDANIIAAKTLGDVIRHFSGQSPIAPAVPRQGNDMPVSRDLRDVRGQEHAKRALEIAAAGRHHLMMIGPPGSGKSMLAACLPGILPPLPAFEMLETSMIHSLVGLLGADGICRAPPFREPHHTASMAAIIGGGRGAKPGEVSLAHNGVLFLDELPEFPRAVLETIRQPIETGEVMVARANNHIKYPCKFMLVAAANPCKCGHMTDPSQACGRAPLCGHDYMRRLSGPLMDRFDIRLDVPPVAFRDLDLPPPAEGNAEVARRVKAARNLQSRRYEALTIRTNADLSGAALEEFASPDQGGREFMQRAAERFKFSARGYHRTMRIARTIADLEHSAQVHRHHIAEAVSLRTASSIACFV